MKKIIQLTAVVALVSTTNGYAIEWQSWRSWFGFRQPSYYKPSEQELNIKHKALTRQIQEEKESADFAKEFYRENPTPENKAYLNSRLNVLKTLEKEDNKIYYEIQQTGTSKTLLEKAPLKEQPGVAENAPALNTIQLLKWRTQWAREKQPQTVKPSLMQSFRSWFTSKPQPTYAVRETLPQTRVIEHRQSAE